MQGSVSLVKTVKTKMRENFREDKKRNKDNFKKHRRDANGKDKRKFSFDD